MRTSDFDYALPTELIAQRAVPRGASRLMVVDRVRGGWEHRSVADLPELLAAGDLLLLNDSRVLAARLEARRTTGRRFELLLLRPVDGWSAWEGLVRPSARARPGETLELHDGGVAVPLELVDEGRWRIRFEPEMPPERLDMVGEPPLPPYIERPDGPLPEDRDRYQTVYARVPGSAAAPTAGLHFSEELLARLRAVGVGTASLTLHVGLGTFRPVTAEQVADHTMHAEWYRFDEATAAAISATRAAGGRVVCVGTTAVRALESALAAGGGRLTATAGWTDLFITPGYRFRGVDALLTNFHLPRSTLLMMVSAFAGRELVLAAYDEAVATSYRFFSYGDAMLIV